MSNKRIIIAPEALNDLREIDRYTQRQHGSEQRIKYRQQLLERIDQLKDNPELGRERPEIGAGYRSINEGKYVIFYQVNDTGIDVLAVLHGQRDLKHEMTNQRSKRAGRNRDKDGGRER